MTIEVLNQCMPPSDIDLEFKASVCLIKQHQLFFCKHISQAYLLSVKYTFAFEKSDYLFVNLKCTP